MSKVSDTKPTYLPKFSFDIDQLVSSIQKKDLVDLQEGTTTTVPLTKQWLPEHDVSSQQILHIFQRLLHLERSTYIHSYYTYSLRRIRIIPSLVGGLSCI